MRIMRTIYCLLFLVFLVQESSQRTNKRAIDAEEASANRDVRRAPRDKIKENLKKLQQLMKQATNSTSDASTQLTATRQGPCLCGGGVCACCSRILYSTWKQKACVNVTYDPDEFSFTAKISMNDRVLYTRSVSGKLTIEIFARSSGRLYKCMFHILGKNPRPVCVPVPRIPVVKACVRFYNIYFQGRNIHLCLNMEGKFAETTMFKVSY